MRYRYIIDINKLRREKEKALGNFKDYYKLEDLRNLMLHEADFRSRKEITQDNMNKQIIQKIKSRFTIVQESYVTSKSVLYGMAIKERNMYIMIDADRIDIGFNRYRYDFIEGSSFFFEDIMRTYHISDDVDCTYQIPVNPESPHRGYYVINGLTNLCERFWFLQAFLQKIEDPFYDTYQDLKTEIPAEIMELKPVKYYLERIYETNNDCMDSFKLYSYIWWTRIGKPLYEAEQERLRRIEEEEKARKRREQIERQRSKELIMRDHKVSVSKYIGRDIYNLKTTEELVDVKRNLIDDFCINMEELKSNAFESFKAIVRWNFLVENNWEINKYDPNINPISSHYESTDTPYITMSAFRYRYLKKEAYGIMFQYIFKKLYEENQHLYEIMKNDVFIKKNVFDVYGDYLDEEIIKNKDMKAIKLRLAVVKCNWGHKLNRHSVVTNSDYDMSPEYESCVMYPEDQEERWKVKNVMRDIMHFDYEEDYNNDEMRYRRMDFKKIFRIIERMG